MNIDYESMLQNPKVRQALGGRRLARALADDDYLPNLISEEGNQVLTLAWDGNAPGCSGANWITAWRGFYFFTSSDYDAEGPFDSLDEAIYDERFWVETANPELTSTAVPIEKLMEMGKALAGEEGNEVFINGNRFVLRGDDLVEEPE